MTEPRTIAAHGSRIIAALERVWAAIQDRHPDVPDVVIVTGAGSVRRAHPRGTGCAATTGRSGGSSTAGDGQRTPELFVAGELLSAGGRAVLEVMLHETAHALAARRGIKNTSAAGNRYHNKRFVALAADLGLRGPDVPDKVTGWSNCTLSGQAAYDAYAEIVAAIDTARLPFLVDQPGTAGPRGGDGGGEGGQGGDGPGKPAKRDGRRVPAECACQPEPQRIQLTPKQIEDGPIICGVCCAAFEPPEDEGEDPGLGMD